MFRIIISMTFLMLLFSFAELKGTTFNQVGTDFNQGSSWEPYACDVLSCVSGKFTNLGIGHTFKMVGNASFSEKIYDGFGATIDIGSGSLSHKFPPSGSIFSGQLTLLGSGTFNVDTIRVSGLIDGPSVFADIVETQADLTISSSGSLTATQIESCTSCTVNIPPSSLNNYGQLVLQGSSQRFLTHFKIINNNIAALSGIFLFGIDGDIQSSALINNGDLILSKGATSLKLQIGITTTQEDLSLLQNDGLIEIGDTSTNMEVYTNFIGTGHIDALDIGNQVTINQINDNGIYFNPGTVGTTGSMSISTNSGLTIGSNVNSQYDLEQPSVSNVSDHLYVEGTISLNGTLDVNFLGSYLPIGESYDLLFYQIGMLSGGFSNVSCAGGGGGCTFTDSNGILWNLDYNHLISGTYTPLGNPLLAFNYDRSIRITSASSFGSPVPEPQTYLVLGTLLILCALSRKQLTRDAF